VPPADVEGRSAAGRTGALGLAGIAVALLLIVVTGLLGPSVTSPSLGPHTWHPAYSTNLRPSPWLVTALVMAALVVGSAGVWVALRALAAGWRPRVRVLVAASVAGVTALLLVPPMGSSDHLSYAAYGRIAAEGADPYAVAPDEFRGGTDPVASAAEAPWEDTTSVYGPLATAEQALASMLAGDSVRATVFLLSLVNALAVLGAGALLLRLSAPDAAARARTVLLWGLNPLVLWALVAGAHVDALGVALGVAALAVVRRSPLAAGLLAGAAASVKLTLGLYVLALLWPLRHRLPDALRVVAGAGFVVLAGLAVAGPDALSQLRQASRFISLGTPWHLAEPLLDGWLGTDVSRPLVGVLSALAACGLVWVLARVAPAVAGGCVQRDAARAAFVLACAWVLAAPYSLPWYDAAFWAPLALLPASRLDGLLLARGAVLSCAYVPGRAVDMPEALRRLTVTWLRALVTPWTLLVATVLLVSWGVRRPTPRPRRARARSR
jgi:hypothetical protein